MFDGVYVGSVGGMNISNIGLESLNTVNVTSMAAMYYKNYSKSIRLPKTSTSNLTTVMIGAETDQRGYPFCCRVGPCS